MNRVDFIPLSFRKARARRRAIGRCVMLLVAVVASMGCWIVFSQRHMDGLKHRRIALRQRIAEVEHQRAEQPITLDEGIASAAQVRLVRKLHPPLPTILIVAAVSEVMPTSMGLHSFSMTCEVVEPASLDQRKRERAKSRTDNSPAKPVLVVLEGIAPDDLAIARFIGRLDQQQLFRNVKLGYSRPTEDGALEAREFQITAEIPVNRRYEINNRPGVAHAD